MTATRLTTTADALVIRRAREDDQLAIRRLAELDMSVAPRGDVLVAEVGGELRAALGVADRTYVADPFAPTRDLVELLDVYAARLRHDAVPAGERLRQRLALWSDLWFRAARLRPSQ